VAVAASRVVSAKSMHRRHSLHPRQVDLEGVAGAAIEVEEVEDVEGVAER